MKKEPIIAKREIKLGTGEVPVARNSPYMNFPIPERGYIPNLQDIVESLPGDCASTGIKINNRRIYRAFRIPDCTIAAIVPEFEGYLVRYYVIRG